MRPTVPSPRRLSPSSCTGVLYGITPSHKTIAIDAATGKLLWRFDSGVAGRGPNRGLIYWTDGAQPQHIFTSVQSYIYALDARTGKVLPGFGNEGRVDVRKAWGAIRKSSRSCSPPPASSTKTC